MNIGRERRGCWGAASSPLEHNSYELLLTKCTRNPVFSSFILFANEAEFQTYAVLISIMSVNGKTKIRVETCTSWFLCARECALQETGLRDPCLIGAVYHNCLRNILPELLQDVDLLTGIIYGSCMMALRSIFFLQFGNSWTACFSNNGEDEVDQQQGLFLPLVQIPYIAISGDIWRLLFVLQKAVTSQWIQNGSEAIRTASAVLQRVRQSLCAGSRWTLGGHLEQFSLFVRRPPLGNYASEGLCW